MDGYIGEIRFFAAGYAPLNWAFCQGQLIAVRSNTALFSILGTTYGGNGTTTFGLPDFQGRTIIGAGSGPGLTPRIIGEQGGAANVMLTLPEMTAHNHVVTRNGGPKLKISSANATTATPANGMSIARPGYMEGANFVTTLGFVSAAADTVLEAATNNITFNTDVKGGNIPHSNVQPYLGMNVMICLYGNFPARN
ncbi:phage Tail Collar Domain protein [Sphingobacterium spiritivorum ATCC 33300]|uniref:Phage Tail Collar Domain protein n=1 Tax=Sphingobacterium spiritivorum ATCC 33300 TaxID=525372 RepID=C2FW99_SPHSI|nr:tail fiber protein [Sphingobacterium spiritivorum]EEI92879.1 phage Tail Collar Domain protein [Sphingobacterium spiritivorum ATCC 33300]QQS96422.1 tail fiber protein [Sphingobacterium spiritivorum]